MTARLSPAPGISGTCAPGFEPVRDAFAANFTERGEVGSAFAVYHRGRLVVDLWGGVRDATTGAPWEQDTLCLMMSVAKGVSAACLALAVDRGRLSLDAPVARYWPGFAAEGKADITVRQVMGHLAGIPVTDHAEPGDIYHPARMKAAIERQAPLWPVGTRQIYHSSTLGTIVSSLLEGATGSSVGTFLRTEIAGPLGADYHIGLSQDQIARCATVIGSANNVVNRAKRMPADTIEARIWKSLPATEDYNSDLWRRNEIPSVNGHGTARGVACIYDALLHRTGRPGLVSTATLAEFLTPQLPDPLPDEGQRLRMGLGFMLSSPPHRPMGPNLEAFGHSGAGGSQAFADPVADLSLCFTTNRMHDGDDMCPRTTALMDATYACVASLS